MGKISGKYWGSAHREILISIFKSQNPYCISLPKKL